MSAIPKDGYKPSPVYEAVMSDGEVIRLSFYCPSRKPIDFAAGRRAMEAIALADDCRRLVPIIGAKGVPTGESEMREIFGFLPFVRDASGALYRPTPKREGVRIVRAFVEHPSIGRVEHKPGMDKPVKPARKPDEVKALALKLCREFEGHCRPGEIAATVQALRGALGLPALAA